MSHDLEVYATCPTPPDLDALVAATPTLSSGPTHPGGLTVLRGARQAYCFTVEGPYDVDDEDVPDEVRAVLLGARWMWRVLVEGSAPGEVPHAARFAKRLAKEGKGACLDLQSGRATTFLRNRSPARPAPRSRVEVLTLEWHVLADSVPRDAAARLLRSARRWLPEALPRRFGDTEPFEYAYAKDGAPGFERLWDSGASVGWRGTGPVATGSLPTAPHARSSRPIHAGSAHEGPATVWSADISLLADLVDHQEWWRALGGLLTSYAEEVGAFYATAELTRDHIWSGTLFSDNQTERSTTPVTFGVWQGLPATPRAWHWLGGPYAALATDLPGHLTSGTPSGALFSGHPDPRDRTHEPTLADLLPANLFARVDPDGIRHLPTPQIRAATIPDALL